MSGQEAGVRILLCPEGGHCRGLSLSSRLRTFLSICWCLPCLGPGDQSPALRGNTSMSTAVTPQGDVCAMRGHTQEATEDERVTVLAHQEGSPRETPPQGPGAGGCMKDAASSSLPSAQAGLIRVTLLWILRYPADGTPAHCDWGSPCLHANIQGPRDPCVQLCAPALVKPAAHPSEWSPGRGGGLKHRTVSGPRWVCRTTPGPAQAGGSLQVTFLRHIQSCHLFFFF